MYIVPVLLYVPTDTPILERNVCNNQPTYILCIYCIHLRMFVCTYVCTYVLYVRSSYPGVAYDRHYTANMRIVQYDILYTIQMCLLISCLVLTRLILTMRPIW